MQVSNKYRVIKSLRDNSVTLVVLPSPGFILVTMSECWDAFLLLLQLCGDVELNPGPVTLQQILEGQNRIAEDITELSNHLGSLDRRLGAIEASASRFNEMAQKFDCAQEKIVSLELCVQNLARKVDDFENRSRRNNLIIYGIKEPDNETEAQPTNIVVNGVFISRLEVEVKSIERVHRLGRRTSDKIRPIIMKLGDFTEKKEVLRNARKLKGSNIFINEDFSLHVRTVQKSCGTVLKLIEMVERRLH